MDFFPLENLKCHYHLLVPHSPKFENSSKHSRGVISNIMIKYLIYHDLEDRPAIAENPTLMVN